MIDTDKPRFASALTALAEVFGVNLSDVKLSLYFDALCDLEWPAFNHAVTESARSLKFFPKPAELRTFVCGDDEDASMRAWVAWKQAASTVGSYSSLMVRDGVLAETLIAVFGSWPEACTVELSPEMWSSKRKEFDRVYRVMAQRGVGGGRYLAGLTEAHNGGRWGCGAVGLIDGMTVRLLNRAEEEQLRIEMAGPFKQIESGDGGTELEA